MPRRSNRILNRDGKKYDMAVRLLGEETHAFVSGDFTPLERAIKIRNIYNIIYDVRELFHMFNEEEFIVKFMKKYIQQGKIILEKREKKSYINICRASIIRTSRYAEKYLRNRDIMIRRAAYKIAQRTCTDASKMIISFL